MTVSFTSRLSAAATPLKHAWEHTVGSCHALLALRADWQEQLRRCHDELGFRHVRFHALLTDDMGTLISHDERPREEATGVQTAANDVRASANVRITERECAKDS